METNDRLLVAAAPHLHRGLSTSRIMWSVSACLAPAAIWGVYIFGLGSLFILFVSIASALVTEYVITRFRGEFTLHDGSAFLTGLLIGLNMPPTVPAFIPVIASVFAIAVVKQTFGGLGRNWMNPALAGRVFVLFSWTSQMTSWKLPSYTNLSRLLGGSSALTGASIDTVTGATPLALGAEAFLQRASYWDLFIGNIPGCIGEVSALLLILGSVYLFYAGIIRWEIPVSYLASFTLLVWLLGGVSGGKGLFQGDVLFHLLAGGLMLGSLYMATDMVTSPLASTGMIVFGIGAGIITFLIRFYGGFPEGVSLAIILMNIAVPLIDRLIKPVKFGFVKEEGK
jgi:electron transport complex protein RnfD